jgi:DNA-directed RNA polymerase specialized sigma24 family protein
MADDEREDQQLLAAVRAGDGQAFAAFYRRRRAIVLAYAGRRTGDPELAADLLAETFAAALAVVLDGARELPREPVAWPMTIAHNKLIDSVRRGQVERAARELRCSEAVVRKRVSRALGTLRGAIGAPR